MKLASLFTSLFATVAICAAGETFTTITGKEFKDVTVGQVEPDGLRVITDDGILKVRFAELSPDVQKRFGYDPAKAAQYSAHVAQAQLRTQLSGAGDAAAAREFEAAKNADAQAALDLVAAPKTRLVGTVAQITPAGAVVFVKRDDPDAARAQANAIHDRNEMRRRLGVAPTSAQVGLGGNAEKILPKRKTVPVLVKGLNSSAGAAVDLEAVARGRHNGYEFYEFVRLTH